jgi:hypothetical protein
MKKSHVTLIIVLLVASSARAQEPKGALRHYDRATQIGTVAEREFSDDKGRIVKVIYYTQSDKSIGPF